MIMVHTRGLGPWLSDLVRTEYWVEDGEVRAADPQALQAEIDAVSVAVAAAVAARWRGALLDEIDAIAGSAVGRIATPWASQASIYLRKEAQARRYLGAASAWVSRTPGAGRPLPQDYGMLVVEARSAMGAEDDWVPSDDALAAAARVILQTAAAWDAAAAAAEDLRLRRGKSRVRALFAAVAGNTAAEYLASAEEARRDARGIVEATRAQFEALVQMASAG